MLGQTYKQWDLAIYKTTAITERVNLQLRADFFNLLNHPNFANPFLPAFIADAGFNGFQLVGQPGNWAADSLRSVPPVTWASAIRSWEVAVRAAFSWRPNSVSSARSSEILRLLRSF